MSGYSLISIAHAASQTTAAAFGTVINPILSNVVNPAIELAFAVAVIVFTYGVLQMVFHGTDAEAHKQGRWAILGGVIGMVIMTCAWGIIYLIANSVQTFR